MRVGRPRPPAPLAELVVYAPIPVVSFRFQYAPNRTFAIGCTNCLGRALPGHRPPVPNCSEADIGLPDLGWSDQRPKQPPRSQVFGRVSGPSPKRPLNGSSRPTADISEATQRQRRAMHTG